MSFRDLLRGLNEEEKGEEVQTKDTYAIWHKTENFNNSYFSTYTKTKSKAKYFENTRDLVSYVNVKKSYDIISDNIVEVYEPEIPQNEPEILPNGIYTHEYGNPQYPERLIPITIRQDKYIDLMDSLVNLNESVENFLESKELYENSCSSYKLGILLYGPPGTGKTTYIREFVRKHDAIVIFLNGVPSRDFLSKIESSTKNRLKIFVFEEAVSMLESSEDIRHMLDFLDGSMSVSSSIYFLSTNYPETIPENVVRNGRIDLFIRVEFPSKEARAQLIKMYTQREAIEEEITITVNMPIVDIREICFLHKKTSKSFAECVKIVEEKNKMLKKHFGKSREIRLA
jgi:hypothetical protein